VTPANSCATALPLHWDEGCCRAVPSSAQDAIPVLARLDVLNTLCHSKSNRRALQLGEGKEKSLLLRAQFCYSPCQRQLHARAEGLTRKAIFVRNAEAPLQPGSAEPTLNSSSHLLRPSHLLGHNHREVEIAVQHPSVTRGIVPVQPDTSTAKQHNRNLKA